MNNESTQQPVKKPYVPLMASAMMMIGLNERFDKAVSW